MGKRKKKRKLTRAEKQARREENRKYQTVFMHGKQKRVLREPVEDMVEGLPVEEFIARNADVLWLHQNEMWEEIFMMEDYGAAAESPNDDEQRPLDWDDGRDCPF